MTPPLLQREDFEALPPAVRAYIRSLEARLTAPEAPSSTRRSPGRPGTSASTPTTKSPPRRRTAGGRASRTCWWLPPKKKVKQSNLFTGVLDERQVEKDFVNRVSQRIDTGFEPISENSLKGLGSVRTVDPSNAISDVSPVDDLELARRLATLTPDQYATLSSLLATLEAFKG